MPRIVAALLVVLMLVSCYGCAGSRRGRTPLFDRGLEFAVAGRVTEAKSEFLRSLDRRELDEGQCIIDIAVELADAVLDSDYDVACAQDAFRALQLVSEEEYCEALYLLDSAQTRQPHSVVTLMIGHSYLKWAQDTDDLEVIFGDVDTLDCRGEPYQVLWRRDYLAAAAGALRRASREAPSSPLPHYLLAFVYAEQGEHEKVKEECSKARDAGRPCP